MREDQPPNVKRLVAGLALFFAASPLVTVVEPQAPSPLTLQQVRLALEEARAGRKDHAQALGIDLSVYNWTQYVYLGQGRECETDQLDPHLTAVLISRLLSGEILLFGKQDTLVSRHQTGEILTFSLHDLDADGVLELLTEEIDGRGTGVYEGAYHVYSFADEQRPRQIWSAPSTWWSAPPSYLSQPESGRAFVKVERQAGTPNQMLIYQPEGTHNGTPMRERQVWCLERTIVTWCDTAFNSPLQRASPQPGSQ